MPKSARLTDLAIRHAKPKSAPYKIAGGGGLCLVVMPDGAKYLRLRYRFAGREKMVSLGVYGPPPYTSLKDAERRATEARALLAKGIDPSEDRRARKIALRQTTSRTFGHAAQLWTAHNTPRWRPATVDKVRQYFDKDLLPSLGKRPLASITPMELGEVIGSIEKRKAMNVAKKARQWLNSVFEFAIASGLATTNPAQHLTAVAALLPDAENHAHIGIDELPRFLRALDSYHGSPWRAPDWRCGQQTGPALRAA